MYIIEVIPIQKIPRALPQRFSYVSSSPIPRLSLVDVAIRRSIVPALVAHVEPLLQKKAALKDADFSLKSIHRVRSEGPCIPEWYFSYLNDLAHYYLVPVSYLCNAALSLFEKTSSIKIAPHELGILHETLHPPKLLCEDYELRIKEYIREIKKNKKQNKGTLVLFPDRDALERAAAAYKEETEAMPILIHSGITKKKLIALWEQAFTREGVVIFSTRMGIFYPPRNLGLIIVEEEAAPGHKSPETPRYHAREAACFLRNRTGANFILGSAMPTLETFYKAKHGEYHLVQKNSSASPPPVVISLRDESEHTPSPRESGEVHTGEPSPRRSSYSHTGGPLILSKILKSAISKTLEEKKQVILFSYRLGGATFTICRRCNHVFRCPSCNVSLVTKRTKQGLRFFCHYCGYERSVPDQCPECNSTELSFRGSGSERVETHLKAHFPDARIARYDSDTMREKGDEESLHRAFLKKDVDILVGTQGILKYADILRAGCVGIILFDTLFHLPDFRSPERAFRIMHTLRRMRDPSSTTPLLVQTWQSDTEYLERLATESFEEFAEEQYAEREELSYPPFTHLIRLIYKHPREDEARAVMKKISETFRLGHTKGKFTESNLQIIGPSSAFAPKIKNYYIMTLLLKINKPFTDEERMVFDRIIHPETIVDMDPLDML